MKLRTWGGVDYLGLSGGSNVSTEVLREGKWEYIRVCSRASKKRRGWSEARKKVGRLGGYGKIPGKRQLWLGLCYWQGDQEVELESSDRQEKENRVIT